MTPFPPSAYWRCPRCQRTYRPREYIPNEARLCAACLGPEEAGKARRAARILGHVERRPGR